MNAQQILDRDLRYIFHDDKSIQVFKARLELLRGGKSDEQIVKIMREVMEKSCNITVDRFFLLLKWTSKAVSWVR